MELDFPPLNDCLDAVQAVARDTPGVHYLKLTDTFIRVLARTETVASD